MSILPRSAFALVLFAFGCGESSGTNPHSMAGGTAGSSGSAGDSGTSGEGVGGSAAFGGSSGTAGEPAKSAEELAFGCVLGLQRELASKPTVLVSLHLVEELSFGGTVVDVASAHVKACDVVEPECVSPIDEGDVDTEGNLTLELPTFVDGWRGYFDIEATSGTSSPFAGQAIPKQRFMAFPRALDATTYEVRLARGVRELGLEADVVDPIVPPEKTVILIGEMYGCDGKPLSDVRVSLDPVIYTPAAYPASTNGWENSSCEMGLALLAETSIGGMWPVYVKSLSKYVGDNVSYGFVSLQAGTWLRVIFKPRAEWPQWTSEFDTPL